MLASRPRPSPRPSVTPLAGALSAALFAPACAPQPIASPPPPLSPSSTRSSDIGLEVVWWAVDDSRGGVGRGLSSFATDAGTLNPAVEAAWKANGLRLLKVPTEKLELLGTAVPVKGPLQRESFGILGAWTPVVSGPGWGGWRDIALDVGPGSGRLSLGPGRLRLLARCWSEPRIDPARTGQHPARAAMRVEILPQHEEAPGSHLALPTDRRPEPVERGLTFDRLELSFVAEPGVVYVIVPETPDADWAPVEEATTDRPLGPPPPATDDRGEPAPPTLGEAMLTDARTGGTARTRVIVTIVAHAPDKFELIR